MAKNDKCAACGMIDSWRHSLVECTMSMCVWALATKEVAEQVSITNHVKAKEWIFKLIEKMPVNEMTEILVTLWAIWHTRRKVIHENIIQSPLSTRSFIERFMADIETCQEGARPAAMTIQRSESVHRWIPPPSGCTKFNVDAAMGKSDGKSAVAVIARSSDEKYLGASSLVLTGYGDPETLEAMAIREAFATANDLLVTKLRPSSDCLNVINTLHDGSVPVYA